MQLGFNLRTCAVGAGFALAIASAPLALAQERQPGVAPDGPDTRPEWNREAAAPPAPPIPPAAPKAPAPPKPKRTPATDEERMLILRMVEQGKLSVEQAEKLLLALSGGKPER